MLSKTFIHCNRITVGETGKVFFYQNDKRVFSIKLSDLQKRICCYDSDEVVYGPKVEVNGPFTHLTWYTTKTIKVFKRYQEQFNSIAVEGYAVHDW